MIGEDRYILKRKLQAFGSSLLYFLCRVFPINKTKIVMWNIEGMGGYGCSPRYIAEKLLKNQDIKFEIVWLLNDMSKEFPKEIKKVKNTLLNRAYHLTTARFWIANSRTFFGAKKRKGTTYIQTWHGSISLKPIGKYRGKSFSKIAYIVSKADSMMIDHVISGSHYCTKMWKKGLVYDGTIIETGTPRCDVLINSAREKHRQFRKEYGLPEDSKIVIYAPTFRGGSQGTQRSINALDVSLDFGRVIDALEDRFGGEWYVFARLHPQLAAKMESMNISVESDRIIDVSQRPDMNEIMAATDAIITDYSTCVFEGFLTGQPGFIYADDWDEYIAERGRLMFDEREIPFPVARNNDELINNILGFDEEKYKKDITDFKKRTGMIEDGKAAARVVDMIFNETNAMEKKSPNPQTLNLEPY